jgi:hypothetical protein
MRLIVVDKANCHRYVCPALPFGTISVRETDGQYIAFYTSLQSINDLHIPAGTRYTIMASSSPSSPWVYQETQIRPAYSHPPQLCGVNVCKGVMPPDGVWIEFDFYHSCHADLGC